MKRICSSLSVLLLLCALLCPSVAAVNISEQADSAAVQAAEVWVAENYEPFYDIRNLQTEVIRTFDDGENTNYTVHVYCETKLKAATVDELPFVQGLYSALNSNANASALASIAVNDYVDQIDFSTDYTVLTLDLVIPISNTARTNAVSTIYYQDGLTTTLYGTQKMAIDTAEMHQDGINALDSIVDSYAGGIPIDSGKWERNKDSENSWAWTSITGLKKYMKDQKGYFDTSTFANANAGNILLTSSSHIVLITLNDTITHRFTGHTNDRYNYAFSDNSGYEYFTIKTT